jgi:D-sedoheptulose 7-phosphate isomerase
MLDIQTTYLDRINQCFAMPAMAIVPFLADKMRTAWQTGHTIYFCGNGGSAGNANHLANDFLYGAGINNGKGLRVESLSANTSVLTCLGNDIGYENIYAEQLRVKANSGDILIALSGSGNSKNILNALETANALGMETFALLGFTGGKAKALAKYPLHFEIHDMQVAEDMQMIIGHICMKWLLVNPVNGTAGPQG